MLKTICDYFSPEAREKRSILAERAALKSEQRSLVATRLVCMDREAEIEKRLRKLKYLEAPVCRRADDQGERVPAITGSASLSCTGRIYVVEDDACLPQTMRERFDASCDGATA